MVCPIIGSPPHTWRILTCHQNDRQNYRITSTYVENTLSGSSSGVGSWDHLHIRGEYLGYDCDRIEGTGSPPHTWRILIRINARCSSNGITSTYVENTQRRTTSVNYLEDHLHIRGEYVVSLSEFKPALGSPPHTWRILICTHSNS